MKEIVLVKKGGQKPVLVVDGREIGIKFSKEEQGKRVDLASDVGSSDNVVAEIIGARQRNQVSTEEGDVSGSFMTEEQKITLATEAVEGMEGRAIEDKYCLDNGIA